ncbi:hypothetical protein GQ53DRAFT_686428 [Thozetella sp. PMI_491]|nr:hypothetical protein GQ53DRAFT_686428 [Thozetella sp. PMI_491]
MVADANSKEGIQAEPSVPGSNIQKHHVDTTINYYDDPGDGSPPIPVYVGSNKVTNERPMIPTPVTVTDVTGEEDKYSLDQHGFAFHKHVSKEKGFHDEAQIKTEHYLECEELMKQITGATRVVVFDHRVRRGPSYWHKLGEGNVKSRGPLHRAHVDQSYDGAVLRLRDTLPDEAEALLQTRRWQIINIWRPIRTIFKDPLAVADSGTVADADLVAASIFYPKTRAESWTIKANPAHRWYFKYTQEPDEILLIKCFDTDATVARRAPHAAFEDPAQAENECRESIEVRCLVFYED